MAVRIKQNILKLNVTVYNPQLRKQTEMRFRTTLLKRRIRTVPMTNLESKARSGTALLSALRWLAAGSPGRGQPGSRASVSGLLRWPAGRWRPARVARGTPARPACLRAALATAPSRATLRDGCQPPSRGSAGAFLAGSHPSFLNSFRRPSWLTSSCTGLSFFPVEHL